MILCDLYSFVNLSTETKGDQDEDCVRYVYIYIFFFKERGKVVELDVGGSAINGATQPSLVPNTNV